MRMLDIRRSVLTRGIIAVTVVSLVFTSEDVQRYSGQMVPSSPLLKTPLSGYFSSVLNLRTVHCNKFSIAGSFNSWEKESWGLVS